MNTGLQDYIKEANSRIYALAFESYQRGRKDGYTLATEKDIPCGAWLFDANGRTNELIAEIYKSGFNAGIEAWKEVTEAEGSETA